MIKGIDALLLSAANPKRLAEFYEKKVGLKLTMEFEMGEDAKESGYAFEMKDGTSLYINYHSEVKGDNKEPGRYMINFEVDDIEKEVARLEKEGAKKIQDIYHIEGYGLIATFEDPDGNYFQFVQVRPTN